MPRKRLTDPISIHKASKRKIADKGLIPDVGPATDPFDLDNPYSLWAMLPAGFVEKLEAVKQEHLEMSDDELSELLWGKGSAPGVTEQRLRIAFWNEFEVAMGPATAPSSPVVKVRFNVRKMRLDRIYGGICSKEHFDRRVTTDPLKLAWIVRPPVNYMLANEELLMMAQVRSREILSQSPIKRDDQGNIVWVDVKLAECQEKIRQSLENRKLGMAVQRTDARNLNLNANAPTPDPSPPMSAADIDKRIRELSGQLSGTVALPPGHTPAQVVSGVGGRGILEDELVKSGSQGDDEMSQTSHRSSKKPAR